ncbi:MAG: symmetrical bis(5'-nucleosyl)-tetraphosphatase [Pseudomonadales bacterium]
MTTYAIGDVQGCHAELVALLETLTVTREDRLWFVGDLVNRGPGSLETLRLVKSLGDQAVVVLGNHDLHWLAIHYGGHDARRGDTFDTLMGAPDVEELSDWLRRQPLVHVDEALGFSLVHAGIHPRWSPGELRTLAREVEVVMAGSGHAAYFADMYGNVPANWSAELEGMPRLRHITNVCTRMRLLHADGSLDFQYKEELTTVPDHLTPWFERYASVRPDERIVFGHWAALDGVTGHANLISTDTGCVWGRELTAVDLSTLERVSVSCRG